MATYKTPGVYVEEISTLPASVAQVETAIPAFIGYTEKASKKGESLLMKPLRIKSILDFETYFGTAPQPESIEVTLTSDNDVNKVEITPRFYLYDSMRMFYANGGGPCYIVAVDTFKDGNGQYNDIDKDQLIAGVQALKKEDEPTLLVTPDACLLDNAQQLADVQSAVLQQCNDLQDRFGILDVYNGSVARDYTDTDVVTVFRNKVGTKFLKYAAAYYPWLKTSLSFDFGYSDVTLKKNNATVSLASVSTDDTEVVKLDRVKDDQSTKLNPLTGATHGGGNDKTYTEWFESNTTANKAQIKHWADVIKDICTEVGKLASNGANEVTNAELLANVNDKTKVNSKLNEIVAKLSAYDYGYADATNANSRLSSIADDGNGNITDFTDYALSVNDKDATIYEGDSGPKHAAAAASAFRTLFEDALSMLQAIAGQAEIIASTQEQTVKDTNPVYANVVNKVTEEAVVLPPAAAMAGIYATVDRNRGVWKAPANISLSSVIGPTVKVDNKDQEDLNVDVVAGKSVNAIRSFTGKGTLVWGARTLLGNDNEWRYVSVRRFYNMVEESIKKATERVVFEPNDANTWVKLKAQIENYLTLLWRQGALAGAVPEQAFFVNIGLGKTMTAIDILEGRLIVEIGMAVVRPAEFIILKFSHKMQES